MNRNAESHFAMNPTRIDMSRLTFDRSHSLKTSFNVGDVVPFYVDEVLPGDTFDVKTSKVVRMPSLITPIMDNIYLDTYFFFVPNRLTWEHWKQFMGENTESAWIPETQYEVPQITSPASTGWNIGTLADYMGVPTGVPGLSVSALPFRAYALVMNEWFRDENLTDPLLIPTDDSVVAGVNTGNYIQDVAKGGLPFKAAKYHDYFTSCLPAPQKGPDVTIPVGPQQPIPVRTSPDLALSGSGNQPLSWVLNNGNTWTATLTSGGVSPSDVQVRTDSTPATVTDMAPSNLWAYPSDSFAVATINQLRMAFQIQKLYERDARGGTRYIEILKSHFGVTSPDARLQRPEYLGGNRIPINVSQIVQQSQTTDSSPQGNPVGLSVTSDTHSDFRKSFVEHGFVIGVMVARYDHTYQQGLERFWSRRDRFDYYWPVFANIGEQAVKNKEIYAQGTAADDEVFGYQEAWADYRYKPSHTTGEMRSQSSQSLDVWHLGDDYEKLPSLSDDWIREDSATVDRVIAVTSAITHQLFADIYVSCRSTRPMPVYSIPGLVDHH
ncbi:major capsid protein [Sigmofec virus UA08Rod_5899]|uniref:Major capsid protein n=1 Tax=Sigmofec virus UA08Rod_5899 TaxID=2929445 RepID=A0A976N0K6_9VIRU|nr:major capsid protein [Sigmofec virus UA08Rod_5899]